MIFPAMNIVTKLSEWHAIRKKISNKSIGFVHTMGHCHAGHLSLCQRAQQENEISVVAIFVNETQFNQKKDFANYPRSLTEDKALLVEQKIDYLLLLDAAIIYADNYQIQIHDKSELSQELEGKYRPGHFVGMLTVVLKYLQLVKPTRAYYGEKDYQQLLLIKKMAKALFLEVEIIGCPTVRAEDGLALSSRNSRLNPVQRKKASYFPNILKQALTSQEALMQLEELGFKVDYVVDCWNRRLAAIYLDDVRLIDNIPLAL